MSEQVQVTAPMAAKIEDKVEASSVNARHTTDIPNVAPRNGQSNDTAVKIPFTVLLDFGDFSMYCVPSHFSGGGADVKSNTTGITVTSSMNRITEHLTNFSKLVTRSKSVKDLCSNVSSFAKGILRSRIALVLECNEERDMRPRTAIAIADSPTSSSRTTTATTSADKTGSPPGIVSNKSTNNVKKEASRHASLVSTRNGGHGRMYVIPYANIMMILLVQLQLYLLWSVSCAFGLLAFVALFSFQAVSFRFRNLMRWDRTDRPLVDWSLPQTSWLLILSVAVVAMPAALFAKHNFIYMNVISILAPYVYARMFDHFIHEHVTWMKLRSKYAELSRDERATAQLPLPPTFHIPLVQLLSDSKKAQ